MPRSRGLEAPQRPSPTSRGPRHLRTSSSDSDPLHQRLMTDRSSPKLGGVVDRRSPRGTQSEPLSQKKLGTRITDLETQLVLAQHELKSLKHQLTSAEAAKKQAQEELHRKGSKKQMTTTVRRVQSRQKQPPPPPPTVEIDSREKPGDNEEIHPETDVFEVPVEKMLVERKDELGHSSVVEKELSKAQDSVISESEKKSSSNNEVIDEMRAKTEEKEKEILLIMEENESLKLQLEEAKSHIVLARSKEEDMTSKLNQLGEELEASKTSATQSQEKLLEVEAAKESLEAEMKKMNVQTEQWRKAADAAAAVLSGNGWVSERCVSMDKHYNGIFEPPINVYGGGYLGSPGAGDDIDDGFGGGKKKGSGIRMLGDLWKKKGQK